MRTITWTGSPPNEWRGVPLSPTVHHTPTPRGAKAETSVYIGDKIAKDVRGANTAGIRSMLLRCGRNTFETVGNPDADSPTG